MAKPNYSFAKRQRDLAKKQKKEEKARRLAEKKQASTPEVTPPAAEAEKPSD